MEERKKKVDGIKEEKKKVEDELRDYKISSVPKAEAAKLEEDLKRTAIDLEKAKEEASDLREQKTQLERSEKKFKEESEKLSLELARTTPSSLDKEMIEKLEEKVKNLKKGIL